MKNQKSLLFKLGALVILIGICAVMMIIGRGHTVYLDNKTLEYEGQTYNAADRIEIYIGGERIARLAKRERGMSTCIGQNFKMDLIVRQEKDGEEVSSSHTITLPYDMDGIVINLPGYLAGLSKEAYLTQFVSMVEEEPVEEEVITDEFGLAEIGTEEEVVE